MGTKVAEPHQQIEQVTSAVSAGAAATGVAGFIAQANDVLVFVATIIAIASGAWTLYDKWNIKRQQRAPGGDQHEDNTSK
jgi:hypothetical protein